MRRWLAGLIGELSQRLQNKLWPPYSERETTTYGMDLTEDQVWQYMANSAGSYAGIREEFYRRSGRPGL